MNEFDLENYFRNVSSCSRDFCSQSRLGDTYCKTHGGVGKRCAGVKKNGDRCNNYANDCGEKCGIHGGFSKRDIATLNNFFITRTFTVESPLLVERYVQLLINRREMRERIFIESPIEINPTVTRMKESISESLISSFAKVSISDDCAICLSEVSDGVRHPCCKQVSCGDCIYKWMCASDKCPYCRAVLT